ncbi:MAG: DUF1799 domain-containing protein [Chromatiales bacterium]
MAWLHGGGPRYCDACRKIRASDGRCIGCNEPEVWEEHVSAIALFEACATQWRRSPLGGLMGLDYAAMEVVARATGILIDRTLLDYIRLMEAEVIRLADMRRN